MKNLMMLALVALVFTSPSARADQSNNVEVLVESFGYLGGGAAAGFAVGRVIGAVRYRKEPIPFKRVIGGENYGIAGAFAGMSAGAITGTEINDVPGEKELGDVESQASAAENKADE